ncbi:soluble lytic murein transglycosylase-like protein [Xanthobacter flavus]|nr:lytic transglycosylase domain-containing protein [Xanthobacter flavus]MBP2149129.1 soluble lytic murein transglycosylase-like protein [Xanthobacter flavus]
MTTLRLLLLTSLALAPGEARCGDASSIVGSSEPLPAASASPATIRPIWGERRAPAGTPRQTAASAPAPTSPAAADSAPGKASAKASGKPSAKTSANPAPQGVCERELARAAAKYQIPLQILYAVALTESGTGKGLQPLMLHIEGKDHIPATLPEALTLFRAANERGVKLIDIGCMQVNWYWHRHEFNSLEEIFDPRLNVEQGARFLQVLRKRHGNWTMAAARYNAGPKNTVAQHRYVCRVMKNLVKAGVGQWTATAEAFCAAPPEPPQQARVE